MTEELYKKYRPTKLSELVGQDAAVRTLADLGRRDSIPHCLLLSGPSGTGKTTIARILKSKLQCSDRDYFEINAASDRGIDVAREVQQRMGLAPIGGKARMWVWDEAHSLPAQTQNCLLKALEDTPKHVYFVLATTHPGKLLKTIRTRCTELKLSELSSKQLTDLVTDVAEKEGLQISEDVAYKIADHSDGSARKALVLLNAVMGIKDEDGQLEAIAKQDFQTEGIELARILMNPKATWREAAKILLGLGEADPEGLRRLVLSYARKVLLSGKNDKRAASVISCFEKNFFDSGAAGLALACWDVICG